MLARFVAETGQRSACWADSETHCNESNVNVLTAGWCNELNVHLCVCVCVCVCWWPATEGKLVLWQHLSSIPGIRSCLVVTFTGELEQRVGWIKVFFFSCTVKGNWDLVLLSVSTSIFIHKLRGESKPLPRWSWIDWHWIQITKKRFTSSHISGHIIQFWFYVVITISLISASAICLLIFFINIFPFQPSEASGYLSYSEQLTLHPHCVMCFPFQPEKTAWTACYVKWDSSYGGFITGCYS